MMYDLASVLDWNNVFNFEVPNAISVPIFFTIEQKQPNEVITCSILNPQAATLFHAALLGWIAQIDQMEI